MIMIKSSNRSNNYYYFLNKGDSAFVLMTSLTQVVLTDGLTILGSRMFHYTAIFYVAIPSTIKTIGN